MFIFREEKKNKFRVNSIFVLLSAVGRNETMFLSANKQSKQHSPTAVKLKNPCSHSPMYAALSLRAKRPGTSFATFGLTDKSSP